MRHVPLDSLCVQIKGETGSPPLSLRTVGAPPPEESERAEWYVSLRRPS